MVVAAHAAAQQQLPTAAAVKVAPMAIPTR